jgi:hypoxanthine-guanine phosphoribosyltransferase
MFDNMTIGEAMKKIHDNLQKEKDKDFLTAGKFKKNHEQAAQMYVEFNLFILNENFSRTYIMLSTADTLFMAIEIII